MKGKVPIIIAVTLVAVFAGVGFAAQTVTQRIPPVQRHIPIRLLCDTVSTSQQTGIPDVGAEGVIQFDCPGSAPDCTFSLGHDCAFTVGNGKGGGGGFTTPTFALPTGYVHLWVMGSGKEAGDCSAFNDSAHWLTSGTPVFLGNISHSYCASVDADTADLAGIDVSWS